MTCRYDWSSGEFSSCEGGELSFELYDALSRSFLGGGSKGEVTAAPAEGSIIVSDHGVIQESIERRCFGL